MASVESPLVTLRRWPSTNCWFGRPYGPPIAFVLHTEAGGVSGTVAEFLNSSAHWSAHYSVALGGTLDCRIDLHDRAWGNGILEDGNRWHMIATACGVAADLDPNHITISCETEDLGQTTCEVSEAQYEAVLYAAREAKLRFPDSLRFLATHADISPLSRAGCPGERWLSSGRFHALAQTLGLETVALCGPPRLLGEGTRPVPREPLLVGDSHGPGREPKNGSHGLGAVLNTGIRPPVGSLVWRD